MPLTITPSSISPSEAIVALSTFLGISSYPSGIIKRLQYELLRVSIAVKMPIDQPLTRRQMIAKDCWKGDEQVSMEDILAILGAIGACLVVVELLLD